MTNDTMQFKDGAAYERYMGHWSQGIGNAFLDWIAAPAGAEWLDVGCGNGAFTQLIVQRAAPGAVVGIDPSLEQLSFARAVPMLQQVRFEPADAMALPYANHAFDVAVMSLVIFFLPDPARGVAEMARVVRPGGRIAAYAWDMTGGGFPYATLQAAMADMGLPAAKPPSPDASRLDRLQSLWQDAGIGQVETRQFVVERTFADFTDYWTTVLGGPSVGPRLASMNAEQTATLQNAMRAVLPIAADGRITYAARANAVWGQAPG